MSKLSIIIIIFLFPLIIVSAEEIRIEPENYWLQTETWEIKLTSSMLIEASLAASGLDSANLKLYKDKYKHLLINFKNDRGSLFDTLSTYYQGEFILNWAHDNILVKYIEEQTFMDVLIDTGNYNCVSSAVFYLILSREAGLSTEIIETSDHAFCTIKTDMGSVDVETTTSYGFNPGIKKEFQQEFNQTGYTYVPPGNYRNRDRINDREAIALILQNRMSALQKHNVHDQAIGLSIDRWILATTEKNYKDMNDSFRNWSAVLNNRESYADAYNFLSAVSQKYNLINENRALLYDLAYNRIITLTNNKNYNLAKDFLLETKLILDNPDQTELEKLIARDYLIEIVKEESYEVSSALVREAYKTKNISKTDWQNWITVLHQNEALSISNLSGWWDAWVFMESLPPEEKNLSSIKTSLSRAHDNWSFEIHNQFADFFNKQEYGKAEQLLLEALTADPDNKYLTQDLAELKKIRP